MAKRTVSPRLLTREQAASYCGVCAASFAAFCPIAPLVMQRRSDGSSNKRLERYDRFKLDLWLDQLSDPAEAIVARAPADWLALMDCRG